MRSFKPTIILLVLAIAGVAAMAFVARRESAEGSTGLRKQMLLTREQLPVDELTRITLRRGAEPPLVLEREGSAWMQVQPFAHPMDAFSIRQLAQQALQLEVADRMKPSDLPQSLSLATLALEPPLARVKYEWSGGEQTVELGKSFVAGRAYMRLAGNEEICVVNQALHQRALHDDPREWRDRSIFMNVGIDSDRIERADGDQSMVLARDRKQWKMLQPVQTRLDPSARDAMMQELGRAQVGGFILDQPGDLTKFGLDKPVATISVLTTRLREGNGDAENPSGAPVGTQEVQKLLIGATVSAGSQDRFGLIEGRPVVVRIPASVLASLFRKPQSLAAATASGVVPADVKSLIIRKGKDELRLERDLEKWRAVEHDGVEVPAGLVEELLGQLTSLQAIAVEFREYPRDLEVATITLYGFDAKPIDTVRIAQEKDNGRWALENGDNVLRIFPPGLKRSLTAEEYGLP